ncbi:glycerophosphodiester phosphodiesterase [Peribacillus glennii]|uniref:Glycerophosphodiester phosphodiesterase n=1 Tax=Peribacillus glennii TaxID=2303991 RepID=A0A372LCW6_9BACI|nr:glycerophosphodiester phosphodiesterase family protein [Peribacillus glennii]RFU63518.1 glycerophosphodiester phosphodiesterase [Peribacillus glennii]
MKLVFLISMCSLIVLILFIAGKGRETNRKPGRHPHAPLKIAHRGAAGHCPENTMSAFKKAVELGVDFIEIDVQLSRDGRLVVIHDTTLERTTDGSGNVRDHDFCDLRKLDAGSWFHSDFKDEKIPAFEELLEQILPHAGILIELKHPSLYPGIEKRLAFEIVKHNLHLEKDPRLMVQSFDIAAVKRFQSLIPSLPAGVLIKHHPMGISNKKLNELSSFAQFVNLKQTMMTLKLKKKIHAHGMKAFTWTVNNQKKIQRFELMKLDGVTTDYPDLFRKKRR